MIFCWKPVIWQGITIFTIQLIGYYTVDEQRDSIYKTFFEENSFVASTAAIIKNEPSDFNIIALEDCAVMQYPVSPTVNCLKNTMIWHFSTPIIWRKTGW
jgi:hypothetical protein